MNIIIKNTRDEARLLQKLIKCYKTQFMNVPDCRETSFIVNYIKLLEWKSALKSTKYDEDFETNSSVVDCLRYACKNHWNESNKSSPTMLQQQHDITPRLYQKTALKARISVQAWEDIDNLLLSKVINTIKPDNFTMTNIKLNIIRILAMVRHSKITKSTH